MAGEANGRRVFAMEISPAYVDVAIERWQSDTGREAILDSDGRTFQQVRTERLQAAGSKAANTARSAVEANTTNRNVGTKGATNRDDTDAAEH
jgi:hypothetical protein